MVLEGFCTEIERSKSMHIIDLHCDTITALLKEGKELRKNDMNMDLERMKVQGLMCQDFAIFVRLTEHDGIDAAWDYTKGCIKFFRE